MSLEEFYQLDPCDVHCLSGLGVLRRRPLDWFCPSEERVARICDNLGVLYDSGAPEKTRYLIGTALMNVSPSFCEFVKSVDRLSSRDSSFLIASIVGMLLEDEIVDVRRWILPELRDLMVECLLVNRLEGEATHKALKSQKTVVHRLYHRLQAASMMQTLARRRYDKKLHLGKLPNGELVLMRVSDLERNCVEAQLPPLDLDVHFPEVTRVESPPSPDIVVTPRQRRPGNSLHPLTTPRTTSTSASTPFNCV